MCLSRFVVTCTFRAGGESQRVMAGKRSGYRDESRHGTHECVRHIGRASLAGYAAGDFADQDCATALTLRGCFGGFSTGNGVFVLADILCQPIVDEGGVLKPQFLVPGAVINFRSEDLLKGAARKIIWPVWHQVFLSTEREFSISPPARRVACRGEIVIVLSPP
jgi:hypothetical protein